MRKALFCLLMLALAGSAAAQKNEIGVLIGGHFPVDTTTGLTIGHAFMVQGNYAHRIASVPLIGAYIEVPVVGSFNASVVGPSFSSSGVDLLRNYSSLFVVPGLKVKIAPSFPVSPYLAAGIGVAHYSGSSTLISGATNPQTATNKAAFDIGGGLDFKFVPLIGARIEVRDIFTGLPSLSPLRLAESALGLPTHQHNLLAGIGLVLRF